MFGSSSSIWSQTISIYSSLDNILKLKFLIGAFLSINNICIFIPSICNLFKYLTVSIIISFVSKGRPSIIWTTTLIFLSFNFLTITSNSSNVWHLFINLEVFSWIVCKPNSTVKKVLFDKSSKYSKQSSLIQSTLVPILKPITLSSFKRGSYKDFNFSILPYVFEWLWR